MSEESANFLNHPRQKPIFMEVLRQGPRDAARLEMGLITALESVLEVCEQDALSPDETYYLLEVHARAVLGALIAFYLDKIIRPEDRDEMKAAVLSAAEAISFIRQSGHRRRDRSQTQANRDKGESLEG